MELPDLKSHLQNHLTDGLVTVVGSGVSAALGLPTMAQLTSHLLAEVPAKIDKDQRPVWEQLSALLEGGRDLESALNEVELTGDIETQIIETAGALIQDCETTVISKVVTGATELPMSRLLKHLLATAPSVPIITTNYDRLIEFGAEIAGFGVDTLFTGQTVGLLDPRLSHESLGEAAQARARTGTIRRVYRKHVRVLKPHGSLDWFEHNNAPLRCALPLDLPRLMITPGRTKYVKGYNQPFDAHRENANHVIDNAARFLVLGYGFNDQQLETHLRPQLTKGLPAAILTKGLSNNAEEVIKASPVPRQRLWDKLR